MKIERGDILTPANAATLIGMGMTLYGAANLNSLEGVTFVLAGRALDLIDGPLARRTHESRFGAALDGTADKIATIGMVAGALYFDAAPVALLGYVFAQNVVNAALTVYAEHKGLHPESSKLGKRGMFFQNLAIGSFALANVIESQRLEQGVETIGLISAVLGVALGAVGTKGYIEAVKRPKK
jgi:phosphatidylglycerophosphate synthase